MKFHEEFKNRRLNLKMKKVDISKGTGISYSRICALEGGAYPEKIIFKNVLKLSTILNWPLDDMGACVRPLLEKKS